MSSDSNRKPTLDDVLGEIAAFDLAPDAGALRTWITKYPEYKREIVDFATDWVAMEAGGSNDAITAEDVDLVVNRTMSRVQAVFAVERPATIKDLFKDAKSVGHDTDSLQRTLGIDRTILTSLAARLVAPATVPLRIIETLAQTLDRTMEAVRVYLRMPPTSLVASRSLVRRQLQQRDFATFVESSLLSNEEKERWLDEAPDPALKE
jgi:hypothetical protein